MSRINLVPPSELHHLHLLAEYRELPRVASYLIKSLDTGKPISIPSEFTLGTGHVKFFYDKLTFLESRYDQIVQECLGRGIRIQHLTLGDNWQIIPFRFWNNWTPSPKDIELSRERIQLRISEKPHLYR